ncbi:MAG: glycogen/starch synthase [Firmicutes bacterium]|nr:glycogen/starch synthase [Bacillota bacterium]
MQEIEKKAGRAEQKLKIMIVSTETVPFIKVTNTSEFVYNTSRSYLNRHHEVLVVMPLFRSIKTKYESSLRYITNFTVDMNFSIHTASILSLDVEGVMHYFIDSETYFNRNRIIGEEDDCERFIFFNKAVIKLIDELDLAPDIINVQDFTTSLIPSYVKKRAISDERFQKIKTVLTLHNIRNQGIYPAEDSVACELPSSMIMDDEYKFYPSVNFLKSGIESSDYITFPSPSFKEECQSPYSAERLDKIFRANSYKMIGILDGIDYMRYDPSRDMSIFQNFDIDNLEDRAVNKMGLMNYYNLTGADRILMCVVGKLYTRKGIDLLVDNMEFILENNINLIVMGTGESNLEDELIDYQLKYPEHLSVKLYMNEKEAVRTFAGCDFHLMPSRSEIASINQLIAMRYGAVPIVRETGTLKDSVREYNKFTKKGEGIVFTNQTSRDFRNAILKAKDIYYNKKDILNRMQLNGMKKDFSWQETADIYLQVFKELVEIGK